MLSLAFIVVFIFCTAIAAASILVGHQFITTYNTQFHRNYFYYLVTFYSFAFYGFWAPIIMRNLLSSIQVNDDTVGAVLNLLPILGVPFLLISWVMLVRMGASLVEVGAKGLVNRLHLVFLGMVFSTILAIYFIVDTSGWLLGDQIIKTEMGLLIGIEIGYMLLFFGIVWWKSIKMGGRNKSIVRHFALLMVMALLMRMALLPFALSGPWILALLILLYFISNLFPLFYLRLNSHLLFAPIHATNPNQDKKDFIYQKYQISKREKEVIEQICLGKSNQQIADDLFISLQTVKDHTHRIYSKIGINSRMKLVQMVNG